MGEVEAKMRETGEEEHSNSMKKNESDCCEEVVRWDTILPRMVLRVLLVEADHSTRQIIAALLRKCSYKVTAVPDGLKAWETLKRKAPDLDLILTEVQLPAISGFALLTLVMEHDFCKNIPVIMMSSHDSVGMVLKCMLKGAADFLIKPVRRNELKNLWQHVWRRHALSRPPQNTTLPQKKLKTASEDNSASNQSSGSVASSQKINECSEKLSEAQDASQLKSSSKFSNIDVVKHEESTKFETESAKHDDETGEKSITFVLEAARCKKSFKSTDLRLEQYHGCTETENKNEVLRAKLSRANPNMNTAIHDQLVEPSRGAINLIATFDNLSKHTDENCSLSGADITKVDFDTQLELSLRRDSTGSSCKQGSEASVEWQILNHTNTSAFSWYSGGKLLQPFFPTPPIPSSKLNKKYDGSNQNQEKMTTSVTDQFGQVGPRLSNSHSGLFPGNGVTSDLQSKGHDNVFTSVFCAQSDVHPIWKRKPVCQKESSPLPTSNSSQLNPDATYTSLNQNVHDKSTLDHPRLDSPASGQCADDAIRVSSAYGSIDNGSDGNATSTVVDKNNPESFSDSGSHNYDTFRGTNSHRSSQREAALEKFRLKRKGRCYEKKETNESCGLVVALLGLYTDGHGSSPPRRFLQVHWQVSSQHQQGRHVRAARQVHVRGQLGICPRAHNAYCSTRFRVSRFRPVRPRFDDVSTSSMAYAVRYDDRTGHRSGFRPNRSDRPVRSEFNNTDLGTSYVCDFC